jgi:hypothetical protein
MKMVCKNIKLFICDKCNYQCKTKQNWEKHLQTKKHNNEVIKKDSSFYCDYCNYTTLKKSSFQQHLQSKKHLLKCKLYNIEKETNQSIEINKKNNISCDTKYNNIVEQNNILIEKMIETNKQLLEIAKTPQTIIYNNNQKTINNTFNLNNFLLNDCNDAPNFKDFLFSLQIGRKDLNFLQENGYIKSYENVIVKQLENMDQTKRPLHCLDQKRKKFIMKDKNVWTKENIEKAFRLSIDHFSNLLLCEYNKWKDDHPEWKENTEDELFDIGLFLSNEILSPYNEKKNIKIETNVLQNMLNLTIEKKNKKIEE